MLTVGVLLLSGSRAFDLAVVGEVWGRDWSEEGIGRVELRWCSVGRANTRTSPYGELRATHGLSGLTECALVLVGGRRDHTADVPPPVCRALRRVASSGAMIASLCAGSFTLAAAGLLDHRQATTHWMLLDALQRAAPTADIRRDVLFTDDGDLLTSAGAVGGLDLNLHLLR
ncbi:MAG: DJ-1/PfpI family protein, partial [Kutzneria sp.]|nr:DJ-1/PfpI family protein [Kutzneria sp.]